MKPQADPPLQRQTWMSILAKAAPGQLLALVETLGQLPTYSFLRPPEVGLTMVRGRAGGTGQIFNLGEMSLTRCVVQITFATVPYTVAGFSYIAGRSRRHAELAALCDALLQHSAWFERVNQTVIIPLQVAQQQAKTQRDQQVEATRVNFLTLQRGE